MINLKSVPSRSSSVVTRKTGSKFILVPVADNIADMDSVYTLNETAYFIWKLIDGENNIEDIIDAVIREYDVSRETASADVSDFIIEMSKYIIIKKDK